MTKLLADWKQKSPCFFEFFQEIENRQQKNWVGAKKKQQETWHKTFSFSQRFRKKKGKDLFSKAVKILKKQKKKKALALKNFSRHKKKTKKKSSIKKLKCVFKNVYLKPLPVFDKKKFIFKNNQKDFCFPISLREKGFKTRATTVLQKKNWKRKKTYKTPFNHFLKTTHPGKTKTKRPNFESVPRTKFNKDLFSKIKKKFRWEKKGIFVTKTISEFSFFRMKKTTNLYFYVVPRTASESLIGQHFIWSGSSLRRRPICAHHKTGPDITSIKISKPK